MSSPAPVVLCLLAALAAPRLGDGELGGLEGWGLEQLGPRLGEAPLGPCPVERWPATFDPQEFDSLRPFERWGELVRASALAEPDAALAAEHCLLMLAQGRHDEAWRALAALPAPGQTAALWPRFLPGLPPGGSPGELTLAPGGVLRPALPPPVSGDPRVLLEQRRAEVRGLSVGTSRVDLAFELRLEGIEVSAKLVSGPAVEFACVLPCPAGFERFSEYADWTRVDPPGSALPIRLTPGGEPWKLWGRFLQVRQTFPGELGPGARLPARVETAGLALLLAPGTPESECLAGLAPALSTLFEVPVAIEFEGGPRLPGDPVRLRLSPGPGLQPKLGRILSLAEAAHRARRGR
jgi:hypothetical protein